ncbi:MAG: nitroreductase family protein [Candidatus Methanofastidiosia archaeon]
MEVLEAIQKRRTVRIPFNERKVSKKDVDALLEISKLSPNEGPIDWELIIVEDYTTKSKLAEIVKEDFGDSFQKDSQKFRKVFSKYPRWLRFSEAKDGIVLVGVPRIFRYIYGFVLSKKFGPLFGKIGIMNSELEAYCKNIMSNPLLFGVFLNRHAKAGSTGIAPIVNTGSMLQNLRLTATSLGLCYQDLGWITATKESSEKARQLLEMSEDYVAINFFRIGYADSLDRQPKKSDFRRDLKDIVHLSKFGNKDFEIAQMKKTDIEVLDAVRGRKAERAFKPISEEEVGYILEAVRWAPTGFNVQPFEFVVIEKERATTIVVLEDKERRDPDPGTCEVLARGGILQNIRLATRALGLDLEVKKPAMPEKENVRETFSIPQNYSVVALIKV